MAKEKDTHGLLQEFIGFTKKQFELQNRVLEKVQTDIRDLKTGQRNIENDVLTIKEDVDAIAKTVSEDAMKVISHERRITRLERTR